MEHKGSNELSHEARINAEIRNLKIDTNQISDGFHSFGELYEHRCQLFISLLMYASYDPFIETWRSCKNSDGTQQPGWFILGVTMKDGKQISYHLPTTYWKECEELITGANFKTLDKAPEWDGHTSQDVLERLKQL